MYYYVIYTIYILVYIGIPTYMAIYYSKSINLKYMKLRNGEKFQ